MGPTAVHPAQPYKIQQEPYKIQQDRACKGGKGAECTDVASACMNLLILVRLGPGPSQVH
jgi:hypothetical protein